MKVGGKEKVSGTTVDGSDIQLNHVLFAFGNKQVSLEWHDHVSALSFLIPTPYSYACRTLGNITPRDR